MRGILKHRIRKALESEAFLHQTKLEQLEGQIKDLQKEMEEHELRMRELWRLRDILTQEKQ